MVREIVKSAGNTYMLNLPEEMIGKTVEVIAFEIASEQVSVAPDPKQNLAGIQNKYLQYPLISHKEYQFNRDDANNNE